MSSSINPSYQYNPQAAVSVDVLFEKICKGDRLALAHAITVAESALVDAHAYKIELLKRCATQKKQALRIGITGVPGAGKSTLIEALGENLIAKGHKVAVLAIDPSSLRSKGSILGDKTRMQHLSTNPNAFIRPSASGGQLGGVASNTLEVITLCETAGYDVVIVETVGVGQSETMVYDLTDLFLLLAVPGTGDELQGIKRGIMEMADIVAINKADGENITRAKQASSQLKNALHLFPVADGQWLPQVITISALLKNGIVDLTGLIERFFVFNKTNGQFDNKRNEQKKIWLNKYIDEYLKLEVFGQWNQDKLNTIKDEQLNKDASVFEAAINVIAKVKAVKSNNI